MSKTKMTLAEADALENTAEELSRRFCSILCKLAKPLAIFLSLGVVFLFLPCSSNSGSGQTARASDPFILLLLASDQFQWLIWLPQILCTLTLTAFMAGLRLESMKEQAHQIRDEFLKNSLISDGPAFELVDRLNEFFYQAAKIRAFELFLLIFTSGQLFLIAIHEEWFGNAANAFFLELLIFLIGALIVFALEMNLITRLTEAYEGTSKRQRHMLR